MTDHFGVLIASLQKLAARGCENFTTGVGSCYQNGRHETAEYLADRCCSACVADYALRAYEAAVDPYAFQTINGELFSDHVAPDDLGMKCPYRNPECPKCYPARQEGTEQ